MGAVSPAGAILLREGRAPPDAPQDTGRARPPRRSGVAEGPRRGSLGPAGHVADPVGEGVHAVGEEGEAGGSWKLTLGCCCCLSHDAIE